MPQAGVMCDNGRGRNLKQVCKSMSSAAGPRSAFGRAIGCIVSGHADVAGDPDDGPVDGAGPEEGLYQGRVRPFQVPAANEAPTDIGTVS